MHRQTPLPAHVPLVVATRGEAPESVHYGSVAVADTAGRLLWSVGDSDFPVFTRSTLKPFQALPFVRGGGPAHFGYSPQQVALLCASHSGEPRHLAAVADMLARAGCSAAQLQCGCHVPLFFAATGQSPPADLVASPLHHNCSGKHAGFLAWCRQHGAPLEHYLDPQHPLQQAIRRSVARLAGCAEADMPIGVDGCGAPNYALPLARLAGLYARLAAPPSGDDEEGAALAALHAAMATHPAMVSGENRDDLILADGVPCVAKAGAEGMQALAISTAGLGIAFKVADGGARAMRVVTAAVLAQLGLLPTAREDALGSWRQAEIRNQAGRLTGELRPVFELRRH